ncbi:MAG TPA: BMP family ABC transporter substrate-binding protein [Gaiellaceae bacterium]|nr:BMP family ABC transporter substrate-binding protein [Gaiellaceae bacterium]
MKVSRRTSIVAAALAVVMLAGLAALVGSSSSQASTQASKATFTAALISDIGKFNDRSFNQSQKEGLVRAQKKLHVKIKALQSNSTSDYIPNLTQAVRLHANLIISAGFLLADATNTVAKKYPKLHFAITDYDVKGTPFNGRKNVMGLTYAANESGCLVGVLAAKMAQRAGKKVIGAVGGLKIPPVDIWIAGYRYCAQKAVPGTQVLIDYSQDFVASDKCKTVAENMIGQGAQVLFQVAGGCGLGTLKAAAAAGIWGIGVDKDQYKDSARVLTSGVKRVDNGVFQAIQKTMTKKGFKGGGNLLFNLKNGGMSVGKINPSVPKAYITLMNSYKTKIIKKQLRVPTKL